MTAVATRVPCPVEGCTYAADNGASIPAHVSMAHPDVPIATVSPMRPATVESFVETRIGAEQHGVKPKRSARNVTISAAAPEPAPEGSASRTGGATTGSAPAAGGRLEEIPLDLVDVGANVRVNIAELEELTASIAEHGVLQPVKVTPVAGDRYLLVWGQRRTLAARAAGLATIPAIVERSTQPVVDLTKRSVEQLVENLHRADLPALDRARAIRDVVASGMSQADLARKLGIAPSTVANDLGLLEAPAPVQELLERGDLTPAHAKAMKGLAPKTQVELAKEAVERGYSAHRTEQEVQGRKRQADIESERRKADYAALEARRQVVDAGIAEQVAKGVDLDVVVIVAASYYSSDTPATWLIDRLTAGGFKNARKATDWRETDPRPGGGVCDCKALHAKVTETSRYDSRERVVTYALRWANACIVPAHRQAKERASEQKRLTKEAVATRVQQHVRRTASAWAIPEGRAIAVDRILAEAALWGLLSYRIPEWAVAHGGTKKNPFAAIHALSDGELAKELAIELAKDFRDKAGYHVDWPALAAELMPEAGDGAA